MKSPDRRFVHELAQHFGILSESQDPEPQRNVVVSCALEQYRELHLYITLRIRGSHVFVYTMYTESCVYRELCIESCI